MKGGLTIKKQSDRYDVSGLPEAQYEPGSRRRVLKNQVGIKSKRRMDQVEAEEQVRALKELTDRYDAGHRFTAEDICAVHKVWLGAIYSWAGQYRQVNLSKENMFFPPTKHVPRLMTEFEKGPLREFTPCRFSSTEEIVHALAVVHAELVLIHPFRDGNGRAARLLSVLMGLQADLPPLDFAGVRGQKRRQYFEAIRVSLDKNYKPMEDVFSGVIRRTLRIYGRPKT